jgi:pyrroline-5-carboxylate reductase
MFFTGLTTGSQLIASCHPDDKPSLEAFTALGGKAISENLPVVQSSDIIFISVKPNVVSKVLNEVANLSAGKLFISIAMGINLKQIEEVFAKSLL